MALRHEHSYLWECGSYVGCKRRAVCNVLCGTHVDLLWLALELANIKSELIQHFLLPSPFAVVVIYTHFHSLTSRLSVCVCVCLRVGGRAATCGRVPATLWMPLWA